LLLHPKGTKAQKAPKPKGTKAHVLSYCKANDKQCSQNGEGMLESDTYILH
jgi:hypothetical protein